MSQVRANSITNSAGSGAPDFPNGLTDNGVAVATTADLGSVTLLGTLATTSGSSVTLSGLTLTSYKLLYYVVDGVGITTANDDLCIETASLDFTLGRSAGSPYLMYLDGFVDLNAGVSTSGITNSYSGSTIWAQNTARAGGRPSGYTTASTSISFLCRTSTFFAGSIRVYGVK